MAPCRSTAMVMLSVGPGQDWFRMKVLFVLCMIDMVLVLWWIPFLILKHWIVPPSGYIRCFVSKLFFNFRPKRITNTSNNFSHFSEICCKMHVHELQFSKALFLQDKTKVTWKCRENSLWEKSIKIFSRKFSCGSSKNTWPQQGWGIIWR